MPSLPGAAAYVPLALGALLALRVPAWRYAIFGLAGFAWTAFCAGERLAERLPAADRGRDFALAGWVDNFPSTAPGQITFSFAVAEPRPQGVPPRVRLTWYDPPAGVEAGARLTLVARLRPPRGLRNPGGFDYERWLLVTGYGATGYVRSGTVAEHEQRTPSFAEHWLRYRARLAADLAAAAPDAEAAALLVALAIGERYGFTEQHWTDFRVTGTSHLVAVSGLHVALIGLCVFAALRRLWLHLPSAVAHYDLEAAALASVLATAGYAALTGFALPAQRSLLMIAVALAVLVSRRNVAPLHGAGLALLLVLAVDPFAPLAASFWLSFGAVALLIMIGAPRRPAPSVAARGPRRMLESALALTRLQWLIGIALLPLTVAFFAECSLVGPFANLLAIPVFNLLLVPLTLAATLLIDVPALGPSLVYAAGVLARGTLWVLHEIAAWPWSAVSMPQPTPWPLALAALGVIFALAAPPLPSRRLAWLTLVPLFWPFTERIPQGAARLTVLDVGHGLAVLVETRSHRLLYDAGPRYPSGFDIGDEVAVPAIESRGRGRLAAFIVSHADNDHAGGAPAVLRRYPGTWLLQGPDVGEPSGEPCAAGSGWSWDGVRFTILHPPAATRLRGNDGSCVLRVATAHASAVIAGDIEAFGERTLLATQPAPATIVVVPHHGSATSSSAAFVAAMQPEWALVSAGYANRWGFPRAEVRKRWEDAGAQMLVTGDSGAITVTIAEAGIAVATQRSARRRYWDPL